MGLVGLLPAAVLLGVLFGADFSGTTVATALMGYAIQVAWIILAVLLLRLLWIQAVRRYSAAGA